MHRCSPLPLVAVEVKIQDGVTYQITIGSNDAGYIYYEFRNSSTNALVAWYSYLGPTQPVPNDRLYVKAMPGGINPSWYVAIWGIQGSWYYGDGRQVQTYLAK